MTKRSLLGGGDLLYGMRAIASHLGIKDRQALYLTESNRLPTFRQGRVICSRRSTLDAWLNQQETEARQRRRPMLKFAHPIDSHDPKKLAKCDAGKAQ